MGWAPKGWAQRKALVGVISKVGGLPEGKSIIGPLTKVIDWGTLGREKVFGVGRMLGWAFKAWNQGRTFAGVVVGPVGRDKLLGEFWVDF